MRIRSRSVSPAFAPFGLLLMLSLFGLSMAVSAWADEDGDEKKIQTADDLTAEELASVTIPSPDRPLHLRIGEKLTYKIGWSWFDVGEAVLTLEEDERDGQLVWKMELDARTNGFADTFYKVRNNTRSWFDPAVSGTMHYEAIQREGSREKEIVVDFAPEASTARYTNRMTNDVRDPVAIISGTWDPMSITYFVRSLPLEVGKHFIIPTTNGKSLYLTSVSVVKRETRNFKSGKREAFLLEPDIKDLGGVFRKSENASVRFWFSADDNQLPLRMESEVAVGKFWAELVRVEYWPNSSRGD